MTIKTGTVQGRNQQIDLNLLQEIEKGEAVITCYVEIPGGNLVGFACTEEAAERLTAAHKLFYIYPLLIWVGEITDSTIEEIAGEPRGTANFCVTRELDFEYNLGTNELAEMKRRLSEAQEIMRNFA